MAATPEAQRDAGDEYEEHHVMGPWGYRVEKRRKEKPPNLTFRNLLLTLWLVYMFYELTGGPR